MFIKDLQPRQTNVDVEGVVEEVSDVREFSKFGRSGKVATAFIKDGTGKVKLSLWNEQIEQVHPGDKVKITKGYVSEFQGELQLTTGKFGSMEVTPAGESGDAAPETSPEPQDAKQPEGLQQDAEIPQTPEPAAPEPAPEEPAEPEKKEVEPDPTLDVEEEDLS